MVPSQRIREREKKAREKSFDVLESLYLHIMDPPSDTTTVLVVFVTPPEID